jgi:hypothetical protein
VKFNFCIFVKIKKNKIIGGFGEKERGKIFLVILSFYQMVIISHACSHVQSVICQPSSLQPVVQL